MVEGRVVCDQVIGTIPWFINLRIISHLLIFMIIIMIIFI